MVKQNEFGVQCATWQEAMQLYITATQAGWTYKAGERGIIRQYNIDQYNEYNGVVWFFVDPDSGMPVFWFAEVLRSNRDKIIPYNAEDIDKIFNKTISVDGVYEAWRNLCNTMHEARCAVSGHSIFDNEVKTNWQRVNSKLQNETKPTNTEHTPSDWQAYALSLQQWVQDLQKLNAEEDKKHDELKTMYDYQFNLLSNYIPGYEEAYHCNTRFGIVRAYFEKQKATLNELQKQVDEYKKQLATIPAQSKTFEQQLQIVNNMVHEKMQAQREVGKLKTELADKDKRLGDLQSEWFEQKTYVNLIEEYVSGFGEEIMHVKRVEILRTFLIWANEGGNMLLNGLRERFPDITHAEYVKVALQVTEQYKALIARVVKNYKYKSTPKEMRTNLKQAINRVNASFNAVKPIIGNKYKGKRIDDHLWVHGNLVRVIAHAQTAMLQNKKGTHRCYTQTLTEIKPSK